MDYQGVIEEGIRKGNIVPIYKKQYRNQASKI